MEFDVRLSCLRQLNLTSNPNPTEANAGWMEFDVRLSTIAQFGVQHGDVTFVPLSSMYVVEVTMVTMVTIKYMISNLVHIILKIWRSWWLQ